MKGRWGAGAVVAIATALIGASSAHGASGAWQLAWGKDVVNGGGTGFEVCLAAADCKFGLSTGSLGNELGSPAAVAPDGTGNVFVADSGHDRIQRFSSAGVFSRTWGKDVIQLGQPGDTGSGFEVCLIAARCQGAAATTGLGGEMDAPEGVAVDPSGNVYVSERLNNRIEKFDIAGNFIEAWGRDVVKPGGTGDISTTAYENCTVAADCQAGDTGGIGGAFSSPNGIAADSLFVYVVDRVNNRIQKFTHTGTFLRTWGKDVIGLGQPGDTGTGAEVCDTASSCKAGAASTGLGGELHFPVAVAPDGTGHVYVADSTGNQVQKFDDVGVWERTWGKDVIAGDGTGPEVCTVASTCKEGDNAGGQGGELNQPDGIAANATSVFVADPYNGRIQEFDPTGRFFALWGGDVVNGGGTGFELCTDAALCKAAGFGGTGGFMQLPGGLGLDGTTLYVADEGNNRIQRFGVEPPVFPPASAPPSTTPPAKKKKCKRKKHKRSAEAAKKKKKCKKKRKK